MSALMNKESAVAELAEFGPGGESHTRLAFATDRPPLEKVVARRRETFGS